MAEHRVESRLLWLNGYMSDFVSQLPKPCMHLSMHTAFRAETSVLRGLMHPPVQPYSRVSRPVPLPLVSAVTLSG